MAKVIDECVAYYLLPWIKYQRVGEVSVFSVFGVDVYQRVGNVKWMMGYKWQSNG